MSNNFCRYLSNGYSFVLDSKTNSIQVKPCCWFQSSFELDSNLAKNRDQYNAIQDWIPECKYCKTIEDSGQQSLRQASFDWIESSNSTRPVAVDIYIDNTCNAACVTCHEHYSTLWYKENQKLLDKSFQIVPNTKNIDTSLDQIVNALDYSDLRYVKFYGGEPLFTDTHLKFLKTIINPQNVTVHYTTNGSIFPSLETLAIWDRFRAIIFSVSLDGTNQQFDYIRWPLPWAKVSKNLLKLKAKKLHNVMFRVEFTVNFLNAWYFDRLQQWVNDNLATNEFGDITELNVHHCDGIFDPQRMPVSLRNKVLEKYPSDHIIHKMIAGLGGPVSLQTFENFTKLWDPIRKKYWQQSFNEIAHHFSDSNTK